MYRSTIQDAPPPSPSRQTAAGAPNRRWDIQGLRAIAVLMVVAFHAGLPVPGGFIGVDVFFVISGFVITNMLHREWAATGRIRFARFYLQRFKRLTPALAVVVAVTAALSALLLTPFGTQQAAAKTAMGAMVFVANFVIAKTTGGYFDARAETNPLLNIWSLSVEEQFYLAFPAILALVWLLARRSRRLKSVPLLVIGCVAVASFAVAVLGSAGVAPHRISWATGFYSPFARAWEFALGAILALAAPGLKAVPRKFSAVLALLGAGMLAASLWCITDATPTPGVWSLLPVAGALLVILAGTHGSSPINRALALRPLVRIGDWSYSIYLWHWPCIVFATQIWPDNLPAALTAAALSFLPATASYAWVEQPIRHIGELSKARLVTLFAATLLPPLLLGAGLGLAARTFFWHSELAAAVEAGRIIPTGWRAPVCISRTPVSERDTTQCQWGTDAPGVPIYLVGDSNAMHFSDALRGAGLALHRPVTALGSHGCPLIDAFLQRKGDPSLPTQCRKDTLALMEWLAHTPPGLVIIGSIDRYWRDPAEFRISPNGDFAHADPGRNADVMNAGLQKTVERLQKAGHRVALLQTIPQYVAKPYTIYSIDCTGWAILSGACRSTVSSMPLKFANALQQASRSGIAEVAARTGAAVFDFRDYFCPDGTCSTAINGVDHYNSDGAHLNKAGSAHLAETLIQAIQSIR